MERRVIATLAIGEKAQEWADVSHPLMRRYAERCGADFFCLSTPLDGLWPGYAKLKLGELLDHYDRLAFIDGDILTTPNAPNVFDEVPADRVGATCIHALQAFVQREIAQLQQVFGAIEWSAGEYFNSGLMVMSRQHRVIFDEALKAALAWDAFARTQKEKCFEDQSLFNYFVAKHRVPILDLGYRFNHTRPFTRVTKRHRFDSFFVHYAGQVGHRRGNRTAQMRKDAAVLRRLWLLSFFRAFPSLARMADLI